MNGKLPDQIVQCSVKSTCLSFLGLSTQDDYDSHAAQIKESEKRGPHIMSKPPNVKASKEESRE